MMRVVILGAGYAGLAVAQRLGKVLGESGTALITLINASDVHVFATQLHKVAAGTASPEAVSVPLRDVLPARGVDLVIGRVVRIDPAERTVTLEDGRCFGYDRLVVALGSTPEYWGIPGLKEHGLVLTGLEGAVAIRERVTDAVARAEQEGRQAQVVIGGGGLTGVELAGELAYRLLRGHRITLVEMAPQLLPGQPKAMSQEAERMLGSLGVTVRTGVGLASVADGSLRLSNGEEMPYDVLIWCGGVRGNPVVGEAFASDKRDRAFVDAWLRAEGYPDVYILGDAALAKDAEGKPVPPTAQAALAQAQVVAEHILRTLASEEGRVAPYDGKMKGVLVSVGPKLGLGRVGAFGGGGRLWKLLKDAVALSYHLRIGAPLRRHGGVARRDANVTTSTGSGGTHRAHIA